MKAFVQMQQGREEIIREDDRRKEEFKKNKKASALKRPAALDTATGPIMKTLGGSKGNGGEQVDMDAVPMALVKDRIYDENARCQVPSRNRNRAKARVHKQLEGLFKPLGYPHEKLPKAVASEHRATQPRLFLDQITFSDARSSYQCSIGMDNVGMFCTSWGVHICIARGDAHP